MWKFHDLPEMIKILMQGRLCVYAQEHYYFRRSSLPPLRNQYLHPLPHVFILYENIFIIFKVLLDFQNIFIFNYQRTSWSIDVSTLPSENGSQQSKLKGSYEKFSQRIFTSASLDLLFIWSDTGVGLEFRAHVSSVGFPKRGGTVIFVSF